MRRQQAFEAYLDDMKLVHIYISTILFQGESAYFYVESDDNTQIEVQIDDKEAREGWMFYTCSLASDVEFGKAYQVISEHGRSTPLIFGNVVKTEEFDSRFFYDGDDLGCRYIPERTQFKLWAPTANDIKVSLLKGGITKTYEMKREDKGVYTCTVFEDVLDASYIYLIRVNGENYTSVDPYAKALTINSKRSVIFDESMVDGEKIPLELMKSATDAIIYEASIRDYTDEKTLQSFIMEREDGTGFTYLKSLGITHLQLMPVLDFKGVDDLNPRRSYNWGYDANHFFALENSYSSDIYKPTQVIKDMKELVRVCHKNGIKVNLDVVYNHVVEIEDSPQHKSVPYYYFQIDENNNYSNATMCGNDIDSTRKMCSKMIVDSCLYLQDMYDIDGLRFDLMGILNTDTLNTVVEKTRAKKPDFMVYGEGWNMPSTLAEDKRAAIINNDKMEEVAHFSDIFRDTMKGRLSDQHLELGYMLGNEDLMFHTMNVLCASVGDLGFQKFFNHTKNVINYVACHDNMTSWDQIDMGLDETEEVKVARQKLLIASVLLAQGIPFIHSGQEFARTKNHINNTYNLGDDINRIDYDRMRKYIDIVEYLKALIKIRKQYACLRKVDNEDIYQNIYFEHLNLSLLIYKVHNETDMLKVFFNTSKEPQALYMNDYRIIFYNGDVEEDFKADTIPPYSVVVLQKKFIG